MGGEAIEVGDKCIRAPKGDTCIIFIHGILSHGETAWTNGAGVSWPQLLANEKDLNSVGIYSFSYRTDLFSRNYSIDDVVDSIEEFFDLRDLWRLSRIIFVGHSTGGIAARRFVVKNQVNLVKHEINTGLFLVASPSRGSKDANYLAFLARMIGNTQVEALKFSQANIWLNSLEDDFLDMRDRGSPPVIGKELYEDEPIRIKKLLGLRSQVVEPVSARGIWGRSYRVPYSDHYSIAKPRDNKAIQHELLVLFVRNMFKKTGAELPDSVSDLSGTMDSLVAQEAARLNKQTNGRPPREAPEDLDLVEGVCTIDTIRGRTRVRLPPFLDTPEITVWRDGPPQSAAKPEVESVSPDQFTLKISQDDQEGQWNWSARGRLRRFPEPDFRPAEKPTRRRMAMAAGAALVIGGVGTGVWSIFPEKTPSITKVRLFDETKSAVLPGSDANGGRARHTLTSLVERSGIDFDVKNVETFFLPFGFVLNNLKVKADGSMNASLTVEGLANDNGPAAWHEAVELNAKDRWKKFDIPKSVGEGAVLKEFGIKEGEAIPIVAIVECLDWKSVYRWSGEVQNRIQDQTRTNANTAARTFKVKLQKPQFASPTTSCK